MFSWRREWDSNPRGALTPTRFRVERLQPDSAISPCTGILFGAGIIIQQAKRLVKPSPGLSDNLSLKTLSFKLPLSGCYLLVLAMGAGYLELALSPGHPKFGRTLFTGDDGLAEELVQPGTVKAGHHLFSNQKGGYTLQSLAGKFLHGCRIFLHIFFLIIDTLFTKISLRRFTMRSSLSGKHGDFWHIQTSSFCLCPARLCIIFFL